MKTKLFVVLLAFAGAAVVGVGAYRYGLDQGLQQEMKPVVAGAGTLPVTGSGSASVSASAGAKTPLYWHDPMVPGQKFDKPGKSPYMDMQLVPVYANSGNAQGGVAIDPRVQQNLGVRTAEVTRGSLARKLEVVGNVAYNEHALVLVTARANGFVERLFVSAPLDRVRKGQPLAEVFVPDWVAVQEEYLSVKNMKGQGTDALLSGARQRMLLAGMNEAQIRAVETSGQTLPRFTLSAPADGVVAELGAREGMTVAAGAVLFRLNGLGSVWINAELAENRADMIRPGNSVEVRTSAYPGRVLQGRVAAILPEVNAATRTLKARIEVGNPGGLLAPGMFATVTITTSSRPDVLLVPSEAVIQTGERKVVMLAQPGGRFQPVDVETGEESGGRTEIRKGLEAGQKIVVSGQFLIDSEASLKATTTRMIAPSAAEEKTGGQK